jgi:hypothetical protein
MHAMLTCEYCCVCSEKKFGECQDGKKDPVPIHAGAILPHEA